MAERQVVFYKCQDIPKAPGFDRVKAAKPLAALPDAKWRVTDADGMEMAVLVERAGGPSSTTRLAFLRIRQDQLHLLASRQLTLWQPPAGNEFSEVTYATIWSDGFMGAITNRDAPSHKKLSYYFEKTSGQQTSIVSLFNPDVIARLKELRKHGLRTVSVKVQASKIAQVEQDRQTTGFSQLWNAGRGTDAATIGIELGVGRKQKARLDDGLAAEAEEIAQASDLLETMSIRGRDKKGNIETINMKNERVRATADIPPGASTGAIFRHLEAARSTAESRHGPLSKASLGT